MELNLAPVSKARKPVRPPLSDKPKIKGSWKKRRQEEFKRSSGDKKRINSKRRVGAARSLQAQEFESGVDVSLPSEKEPSEPATGAANPPLKKRKVGDANTETHSSNYSGKSKTPHAAVKQREKTNASKPAIITLTPGQTVASVKETLSLMGAKPVTLKSKTAPPKPPPVETTPPPSLEEPIAEHPKPKEDNTFTKTGLYHSICHHVTERLGFRDATNVQKEVLKATLQLSNGQQCVDLLVRSPTGSGKTLAYLLPVAHYLLNRTKRVTRLEGALAVVIVPTRELADQVAEEAQRLFRPWHWIVIGSVIGGESKSREKARLRKGINVLVATPGRLLDHMRNTQSFLYGACEFLILDEADRLLDLGFESEIKDVVINLDKQAQISNPNAAKFRSNILLSATLRKDVEKLAKFSLDDPVEISVAAQKNDADSNARGEFAMPLELQQHFCVVEQKHRLVTLASFLRLRAMKDVPDGNLSAPDDSLPPCKIIVFFSTCDSVDFHFHLFNLAQLPSELRRTSTGKASSENLVPLQIFKLHGNHSQHDRTTALRGFRNSHRSVLLCTDVAARGLDLKGLTFAVQYDPPTGGDGEELEYTHRAGRTARMGERGDALLFLLPSERAYVGKLETTGVKIGEISGSAALAALYPRANLFDADGISYATRLVTSAVQIAFEEAISKNKELKQEAVEGFQSYCRAYATHAREVRHFFHVRNLHLGHVARAFVLSDKPVEFTDMMTEVRRTKAEAEAKEEVKEAGGKSQVRGSKGRREIARAIAEGERQPYNSQMTALARRRREKGRGQEAFKEMAMEFDS